MRSDAKGERLNPFHLGVPGAGWMTERIEAILAEARVRGTVVEDPSSFLLLAQVGASLLDLRPDAPAIPLGDSPGAAIRQELFHSFGMFFFQAFHLLRPSPDGAPDGAPAGVLLEIHEPGVADLVAPSLAVDEHPWALPALSGYVALPPNRFWTRPHAEDAPAEALDGIGWVRHPGPPEALVVVAIGGVIPGRPGFSVLAIPPVPLTDAPRWMRDPARPPEMGEDFAPNLPGAALGGLHGVETAGEILKLLARAVGLAGAGSASLSLRAFPVTPDRQGAAHDDPGAPHERLPDAP